MVSGLVVNTKYPHLGASPDRIIECECCGIGCLEIKCPYCFKDASPETVDYIDEKLWLKQNHMYYYQVQAQIHICQVEFADFVIWSPQGLHIERIVAFFTDVLINVEVFYKYCLLPELAGKWCTVMPEPSSPSSSSTTSSGTPNPSLHDVTLIGCDFPNCNCKIKWFCLFCLKLKSIPKGNWNYSREDIYLNIISPIWITCIS